MINELEKIIGDKKVLILGFGKEGQSTYHLLRKCFPAKLLTVADADESLKEKLNLFNDTCLKTVLGKDYLSCLSDYDVIIKTPGVSFKNEKPPSSLHKITSQTDIFINLFSKQIVGVTGTKGKSTTVSLIYHIVKSFTQDVVLVGNIGIPPFDLIDKIGENTIIVCELSSHQLEFISKSPHIAVLLNLYEEHLDHYTSLEKYHQAKLNLLKCQKEIDYFIYSADDPLIVSYIKKLGLKRNYLPYTLSTFNEQGSCFTDGHVVYINKQEQKKVFNVNENRQIRGDHNLMNIMAVINVCQLLNIPDEKIIEGIASFKGLEHRAEYVGKYKGIHFYNDSIATIPQAAIHAVQSLKYVDTLILGGFDRGIDYMVLIDFLGTSSIGNLIFIDQAGKRMLEALNKSGRYSGKTYFVNDLQEAVDVSINVTRPDYICLLSPAAASYGMFKNFEERGTLFKKIIRSI